MKSVAIIGAGITGLTAAFRLQQKQIQVAVYEAGTRVGGVIQSLRQEGYLAEFGPNTLLETSPKIGDLIRAAGLESRKRYSDERAGNRYLVRYQRTIAMPTSPVGFFASPMFSVASKLRLMREPFLPPWNNAYEESVAQFVVRRLGQEFLDYAIDALVAGVYAGDPHQLSVKHGFPRLYELEQKYGSLIKGQLFGASERKQRGEVSKQEAKKVSFDEGLQVLPDTLSARLGEAVRLDTAVVKISRQGEDWAVTSRTQGREVRQNHSAVLLTIPTHKLKEIQLETSPETGFAPLAKIHYPPVASVVLGFRRQDVAHKLDGFGMLIPKVENFNILGTLFSSSLFPNRAPEGFVTLTSYLGGMRHPELALRDKRELYDLTVRDLRVLLGLKGEPTFRNCIVYPQAIPQYVVGYGQFKDAMNDLEAKAPGMFMAGHFRHGISLSDSLVSGYDVADRIERCVHS